MKSSQRDYRATFILQNRGQEETIEEIVEGVKQIIVELRGNISAVENIGRRDFARVTDRRLTGANYVHVTFSGPADVSGHLRERLRLNASVYRTFIQTG
jgi:small subunit ribosomal protein S6